MVGPGAVVAGPVALPCTAVLLDEPFGLDDDDDEHAAAPPTTTAIAAPRATPRVRMATFYPPHLAVKVRPALPKSLVVKPPSVRYGLTVVMRVDQLPRPVRVRPHVGSSSHWLSVQRCAMYCVATTKPFPAGTAAL